MGRSWKEKRKKRQIISKENRVTKLRRSRKSKINGNVAKKFSNNRQNDDEFSVEKTRLKCRRYEEYHDHFLTYDKIVAFLQKVEKNNSGTVQLVKIGDSKQGKPIYMVILTNSGSSSNPKLATFLVAGLNGENAIAVSNALYVIDYLSKNRNFIKLMNYFVVPCSNPDAYDHYIKSKSDKKATSPKRSTSKCNLKHQKKDAAKSTSTSGEAAKEQGSKLPKVDLTLNFPVVLGLNDMSRIPSDDFVKKIKEWKDNFQVMSPETRALMGAIYCYQFAIKLLICLQEGGESICYPYGFCNAYSQETADLKTVAQKGKCGITHRNFQYGSIHEIHGLTYGHLIDFLKVDKSSIKYTYVMQVHKKTPRYNEKEELKHLMGYGEEIMDCLKRMTCAVYKFYTNMTGNKKVEPEKTKPCLGKRFPV